MVRQNSVLEEEEGLVSWLLLSSQRVPLGHPWGCLYLVGNLVEPSGSNLCLGQKGKRFLLALSQLLPKLIAEP